MLRFKRSLRRRLLALILFLTLALLLPRVVTGLYARSKTYSTDNAPRTRVALVFGAGLRRDGTPTPVLQDRVRAAVELYRSGKVSKILMSGDNRFLEYNEPGSMRDYAVALGVPEEDIVLDYAGRRTYDSCYRARAISGLEEVLLVTQKFHLPRAVFTCNALGVRGLGVSSDLRTYSRRSQGIWTIRELPATLRAIFDVWITRPEPVLGAREPIL